jgi:putative heme-binding domain-containing protein
MATTLARSLLSLLPLAGAIAAPPDAELGRRLFQTHCSYCHGTGGEGGRGPDLTTGRFKRGGTGPELFATIRNGIRGTEMPSVRASDEDVWRLVAFVKTLSTVEGSERSDGDARAGKAVFEATGKCGTCHAVGNRGGSLGPDLAGIGLRRTNAYLRESLVKPGAVVAIAYRALGVYPLAGEPVSGIRLNEDDVSLQIRDTSGNLRSFLKADLREIVRDQPALMPSFESLPARQLEDLVAYLSSLRDDR